MRTAMPQDASIKAVEMTIGKQGHRCPVNTIDGAWGSISPQRNKKILHSSAITPDIRFEGQGERIGSVAGQVVSLELRQTDGMGCRNESRVDVLAVDPERDRQ